MHRRNIGNRHPGKRLGLGQIRRDQACQRQQPPPQHRQCVRRKQTRARRRNHHRIDHHRHALDMPHQRVAHRLNRRGVTQHAGLDDVRADVVQHHRDLLRHEFRRHHVHRMYAQRVLRSQRGDRGGSVRTEYRDGLDVRLDAGTAAGIRTGDHQHAAMHQSACSHTPGLGCDHLAQLVHHPADQGLVLAFRHDADQRFGAALTDQQPATCRSTAPRPPRSPLHALVAQRRRTGEAHVLQQLRQRREHAAHLARRASLLRRSPPAPAARPPARRPVVAKSDRIRWPDCSPPRFMPDRAHLLGHVAVADLGAMQWQAAARPGAAPGPRLDITVATMPLAAQPAVPAPGLRDQRQDLVAVDQLRRSRRPSSAGRRRRPARCRDARHAPTPGAQRYAGTVEPQPWLMLKPSGATPTGMTVAPSSHSTVGATRYAAPCAQSTTIFRPSSRRPRGKLAFAASI